MLTDLLFYTATGHGQFRAGDGQGNTNLIRAHDNWRPNWTHIIPGSFSQSAFTDLLFYDAVTGHAEIYTSDGQGDIQLLRAHDDWRSGWTQIVPGNFGGAGGFTDLLFYDADAGRGEFSTSDGQGNVSLLRAHDDWRPSWTRIVPGHFGAGSFTDLLFYDAAAGEGEFFACDGFGNMSSLHRHNGWRSSWSHVIPGDFASGVFTDLLFYDAAAGHTELWRSEGQGNVQRLGTHDGWGSKWTEIIPGSFSAGNYTDLFFYDAITGRGELYASDGQGNLTSLPSNNVVGANWSQVLPGRFGPATTVRLHFKILTNPNISPAIMLNAMQEVYGLAGIRVIVGSTETLPNLQALFDVEVGNCTVGQLTSEQLQLFQFHNNVGAGDIVVYFVRSTVPPYNGCAVHPEATPGAVIVQNASQWTLAHEVGHVLGLSHITGEGAPQCPTPDFTRLMTACGTGHITATPRLTESEINLLAASMLTVNA